LREARPVRQVRDPSPDPGAASRILDARLGFVQAHGLVITLLTPTRNAARHLPECIASVRRQDWTRERLQHLVLDGNSTDGTIDIARESGAEVSAEPDVSLYEALNRGVRLARGEITGWLNADDVLAPGSLSAVARMFARDPALDLVVGDCCYASPELRLVRRGSAGALGAIRSGATSPQWVVPLAAWFRTATLRRLGPYDVRYRIAADLDLWFRAASAAPRLRVAHAGAVLGTFRIHDGSLSTGTNVARTTEETLAVCSRWMTDPAAPPGVRRHALYVHRREDLAARIRGEAHATPLARFLRAVRALGELQSPGIGAAWDNRELLLGAAARAGIHLSRVVVGRS
jgi:glycosyltransferase involved in cell wall biosynthesis